MYGISHHMKANIFLNSFCTTALSPLDPEAPRVLPAIQQPGKTYSHARPKLSGFLDLRLLARENAVKLITRLVDHLLAALLQLAHLLTNVG